MPRVLQSPSAIDEIRDIVGRIAGDNTTAARVGFAS
jgi:hypothetical protein